MECASNVIDVSVLHEMAGKGMSGLTKLFFFESVMDQACARVEMETKWLYIE